MNITFLGAAREVTGSCYLLETDRTRILVDCGAFQGSAFMESQNFQPFGFDAKTIDAVVITHAHLDHVGRLPKLVKEGFHGKIYLTPPTAGFARLVLEDAFQIMEYEFRKQKRPMLYEAKDIESALRYFSTVDYNASVKLGDLSFRFRDAGHIFGSAFIEIREEGGAAVTFSGDIGNDHVPILRETAQMAETDILVIESTYGNRIHEDESTRAGKLKEAIVGTVKRGGVLLIPAFAIERTQQLLYEMHDLKAHGILPPVDVYLDSPMAIKATQVIKEFPEYYDAEALAHVSRGDDMLDFPGLHVTPTRDDSKTINDAPKPKVIIAGAGMMNGGRILHHLVRYLGSASTTVLIIGYQAQNTLGRRLYEGDKYVDVLGERIQVKATVVSIGAYSAHGDQNKLVRWVSEAAKQPSHIYCTHGDEGAAVALATRFTQKLKIPADAPRLGDVVSF
ncbi:MAG: MBL fold metallo-hydrolase [Candidatus Uhrbacteria bacterium]|nr:MBL fold metallo-hydrolase [Candidatus Uhrbacteria bacterium]